MLWSDIRELKSVLQIDPANPNEDLTLGFYLDWASDWAEDIAGRDFSLKTRTLPYSGTGCQKMTLRHRPVYPTLPLPWAPPTVPPTAPTPNISILFDPTGYFGSASGSFNNASGGTQNQLLYGQDFCLQIDQDDGSSRSAILYRINEYWYRPQVRQAGLLAPFIGPDTGSYMVTYTAGFTVDTLPGRFRAACNALAARFRYFFPIGMEINSDSYEEKNIGLAAERDDYLMSVVKPMFLGMRNWRF